MIDLLHLPEPDERTVWFPGQGASSNLTGWRVWTKPRGISMVSILAIGSGGGGGGGASAFSGSTANGGAPGAGAPMAKMLFPAWTLPDELYVLSVSGGAGGSAGADGNNGGASLVSVYPSTTAGNHIISTNNGGRGGFSSGTSQTALAGPAATTAPLGQMAATQLFIAGTSTGFGSAGTTSSVTPVVICPGGGGGGKTTGTGGTGAGYSAIAETLLFAVPGVTAETGADASSGFIQAGFHYGGCGGGGNNSGVGGRGGNGVAWGTGGGGGGGG